MRLVVVGAARGWHATRIAAEASRRGHGVTVVEWPLLGAAIDPAGRPAVERFLPAAVDAADVLAVRSMPAGRLEEVILRMDLLGRIAARGTPVINAPGALETAIDKYLSLARLAAAGIPVPRTVVAQDPDAIRAAWESLGRDAVVKPLFGSCGRGIERVASAESLGRLVAAAAEGGTATYCRGAGVRSHSPDGVVPAGTPSKERTRTLSGVPRRAVGVPAGPGPPARARGFPWPGSISGGGAPRSIPRAPADGAPPRGPPATPTVRPRTTPASGPAGRRRGAPEWRWSA